MARVHFHTRFFSSVLATFALATASHAQNTRSTENSATKATSKSQPAVPVTMTECEGTNNCATWGSGPRLVGSPAAVTSMLRHLLPTVKLFLMLPVENRFERPEVFMTHQSAEVLFRY